MIYTSAKVKDTIKQRSSNAYLQISECLQKRFQEHGLSICGITASSSCYIVHAISTSLSCLCPDCGSSCRHVHKYYTKTLESLSILGIPVIIKLRVRYFYCDCPECRRCTFSEPLEVACRYARKTRGVEQRILHLSLNLSFMKASTLLREHHIHASSSECIRRVKRLGISNPPCQSIHIGIDDFASKKGHVYRCMAVDHDTGRPVAVFSSRYGEELNNWLRKNPQIAIVTRDGSHDYAHAISENLPQARQVSDRFHLIKNLSAGVIDSIQKMLYQTNETYPVPHPCLEEAYQYMFKDICEMGEKQHREKLNNYLKIKEMTTQGYKLVEIAAHIGKSVTYTRKLVHGISLSKYLDCTQRKAMKYLSEVAGIVANGFISVATIAKRMEGKLDSYLISRMMRTITSVYTQKRRLVREHNKALKKSRSKEKVPVSSIRCLIFKGETKNKKLLKELQANKDILNIVNLCICFRKMLKQGQGNLNEWIQKAKDSKNNSLVRFAYNIEADKQAVQAAIDTRYSNALLEGSVNRVKSIKRTMYNRAGIELLRVKIIYGL